MNQVPILQPGEKAKNFSLKDHEDKTFGLYEHMGRRVLLSFHPLAWTPVCAAQMKSLEENREFSTSSTLLRSVSAWTRSPAKKPGPGLSVSPVHRSSAISGRTGTSPACTDFSGTQTAFPSGQMSLLTNT